MDPHDRISSLPDPILHRIFSTPPLSSRELVQSSTLSKRWVSLWRSSPFISLHDANFMWSEEDKETFIRFADALLLLRSDGDTGSGDLQSFCVEAAISYHPNGQQHLYNWLRYAVNRNVKRIDLDIRNYSEEEEFLNLPRCVFTSQVLEELSLVFPMWKRMPKTKLPGFVSLERLRKLNIKMLDIDGGLMAKLVSGCPVLERLSLDECFLVSVDIAFGVLRELDVTACFIAGNKCRISCPSLVEFNFGKNCINLPGITLENLSSLVRATVVLGFDFCFERLQKHLYEGRIDNFIGGLSNARTLKIISSRVPWIEIGRLPTLYNLKNLTLGGRGMSKRLQIVAYFMMNSPNLQTLTLTDEEAEHDRLLKQEGLIAAINNDAITYEELEEDDRFLLGSNGICDGQALLQGKRKRPETEGDSHWQKRHDQLSAQYQQIMNTLEPMDKKMA